MRNVEVSSRRRIGNVILISPYVNDVLPDVGMITQFAIPNPVDPAFCVPSPLPTATRTNRIISVGRISRRKNTLGILKLLSKIMSEDASVTASFCGEPIDGEYFEECRKFTVASGMTGRVQFHGTLATADLIALLDTSALLVQASLQETAPVAVAEAQTRGVPVLAPCTFGLKYMIQSGFDGLFLVNEAEGNLQLMRSALAYNWDRGAIASVARHRYGVGNVVQQTLNAYRRVLAEED
jgi:glycosyltransferase involved in cell wall biosynthesis